MPDDRGHRVFAALYDRLGAPAERGWLGDRRRELLAAARGVTVEIGAGTGANLAHLPAGATPVLSEPDPAMRRRLHERVRAAGRADVRVEAWPAEAIGMPDASADTVVSTLALCTVDDPNRALAEVRRVLRPDGELLFMEHVRGTGRRARWQRRLVPIWRRLAAGCHPDRDTVGAMRAAGLDVEELRLTDEGPGPRLVKPLAIGRCRRRA